MAIKRARTNFKTQFYGQLKETLPLVKVGGCDYTCYSSEIISKSGKQSFRVFCKRDDKKCQPYIQESSLISQEPPPISNEVRNEQMNLLMIDTQRLPKDSRWKYWGKIVEGIDETQIGGYAIIGPFLREGFVTLPIGALVLWYHEKGSTKYHYPYVNLYKVISGDTPEIGRLELLQQWEELPYKGWEKPVLLELKKRIR